MVDLKKTQAEWTALFKEFIQYARPLNQFIKLRRRYVEDRNRVLEQFDVDQFTSNWKLSGVERGINSTEDAQLFVKIDDETPGAGQAQIGLYKDSGLGAPDLVAEGDAADSSTLTLVEQNNSGISGTVDIGVVTASSTDRVLAVDIDEPLKARTAFEKDRVGNIALTAFLAQLTTIAANILSTSVTLKADLENSFIRRRISDFLQSATTVIASSSDDLDTNGDVVVTLSGLLEELADAMDDESVAPKQFVKPNVVTVDPAEFDPDNVGLGAMVTISTTENAPSGTMIFTCTTGVPDSLSETLGVVEKLVGGQTLVPQQSLTIKKEWESSVLGVRLRLDRQITDVNDGSSQVGTYIINGETVDNTDKGDIYQDLTDIAGTRTLDWYKDVARTLLVATGTRVGDGVITMSEANGSGLSGSAVIAFTVDDIDMIVKLNPFAEGDKITIPVSNDEAGALQTMFRSIFNFVFPSSGSPTLPDTLLFEGIDLIEQES